MFTLQTKFFVAKQIKSFKNVYVLSCYWSNYKSDKLASTQPPTCNCWAQTMFCILWYFFFYSSKRSAYAFRCSALSAECAWRSWWGPVWFQDSCRSASFCFQASSQAAEQHPHCFAKVVNRMWWGAGPGIGDEEIREQRDAISPKIAHSASGLSRENRSASWTGSLLQQFDWKPSQFGLATVWRTMFSAAAMWFSWKVNGFSYAQLARPHTDQHPIHYTVLPRHLEMQRLGLICSDFR